MSACKIMLFNVVRRVLFAFSVFLKELCHCALTSSDCNLSAQSEELQRERFLFLFSFQETAYQNSPAGRSTFMLVFIFIYLIAGKSDNHLVSSCPEIVVDEAALRAAPDMLSEPFMVSLLSVLFIFLSFLMSKSLKKKTKKKNI